MTDQPGYWMYETGRVLVPAIQAYLGGGPLTGEQIAALRAYLRQWIASAVWDQNPHAGPEDHAWLAGMRLACDALVSRRAIEIWIEQATKKGLDPL